MKYKNYTWPYNPGTFSLSSERTIIQHKYPDVSGAELEDMGDGARIFSGEGEFFGSSAYSEFNKLKKVYDEGGVGKLVHPTWGTFNCVFSKLSLNQQPLPNYVSYSFEFVESKSVTVYKKLPKVNVSKVSTSSSSSSYFTYTIKKGDTLWDLAKKYLGSGTKYKEIANLNKSVIKDPHWIYPGQKIKIPKK